MMSSPHITKKMRVEVNGVVVDVVELVNLEVLHQGNVESEYGQDFLDAQEKPRNRHKVGMKNARFTIRRWYKAGSVSTDLFYDLHNQDTVFTLKEYLTDISNPFAGLEIDDCEIYRYTPETGTANDIIIEEIQGEGLLWTQVGYYIPSNIIEFDEPLDWGYFKVLGEVWFAEPDLSDGGGYIDDSQGEVFFFDPLGIDIFSQSCGGAYFDR